MRLPLQKAMTAVHTNRTQEAIVNLLFLPLPAPRPLLDLPLTGVTGNGSQIVTGVIVATVRRPIGY